MVQSQDRELMLRFGLIVACFKGSGAGGACQGQIEAPSVAHGLHVNHEDRAQLKESVV